MNKYDRNKLFPNYPNDAVKLVVGLANSGMISHLNSLVGTTSLISGNLSSGLCEYMKSASEIALNCRCSIMDAEVLKSILSITNSAISSTAEMSAFSSYIKTFQSVAEEVLRADTAITNIDDSEDYVIVDKSSVEEFELPDSVALPIGNKRVKIKTEIIISVLATIVVSLVTFIQSEYHERKSLEAEQQYYESKLREEREQNQILEKLIDSIDYSESTCKDSIESLTKSIHSLTEVLQSFESVHSETGLSPDQFSANPCSNHE